MALSLRFVRVILVAILAFTIGCRLASNAPAPQRLADFKQADGIVLKSNQGQQTISDQRVITRLERIYSEAKWIPYRDTLPGQLSQRSITLRDDQTPLCHFDYTGTLWEGGSYTELRTAELSEEDRRWLDSLFAMIPQVNDTAPAESRYEPSEKHER